MSLSKSVFDALKSILTIESRLETLTKSVEAVSEKIETHAARISVRTRSPAIDESASRFTRSSSFLCSVNFSSWYSGV